MDCMIKTLKYNWQYISVIAGIVLSIIRVSFSEGAFRQRCDNVDKIIETSRIESIQTKKDIAKIRESIVRMETIIEIISQGKK